MGAIILNQAELDRDGDTYELQGYLHGDSHVSLILVDMAPGDGPRLHSHPYEEIFVVQAGEATYTIGAMTQVVTAGQIAIVPPHVPHKFINTGTGRLRQVDIHVSPRFITDWLEDDASTD